MSQKRAVLCGCSLSGVAWISWRTICKPASPLPLSTDIGNPPEAIVYVCWEREALGIWATSSSDFIVLAGPTWLHLVYTTSIWWRSAAVHAQLYGSVGQITPSSWSPSFYVTWALHGGLWLSIQSPPRPSSRPRGVSQNKDFVVICKGW